MRNESADDLLEDWFVPGIEARDVAALTPLTRARSAIQALTGLFNGGEAAVLIRLHVLNELGKRSGEPWFLPSELRQQFAYLDETKLEHLITRLRAHGVLGWDAENSRYSITPIGRMLIAGLGALFAYGEDSEEGEELGYLAGQLAARNIVGGINQDDLQQLLARLTELKDIFERAILSGSETRTREAAKTLDRVWPLIDKCTDVLRTITESQDMDIPAHRAAQRVGQVQSELLRMSGAFQRALSQLESQKVHLGASGLSTTDISAWLRTRTQDQLVAVLAGAVAPVPNFSFVLGDIALDVAEFELVDKLRPERLDVPLPAATEHAMDAREAEEPPDFGALESWRDELRDAPDGLPLENALPQRSYELSSYRLSLLSVLGDRESSALDGPMADLARIRHHPEWSGDVVQIGRDGVDEMSAGRLRRAKG